MKVIREDVIDVARSQVGYTEKGTNWTIYARDLDAVGYYKPQKKQNVEWCATFLNWCFYKVIQNVNSTQDFLHQPHTYNLSAGAGYMCQYFEKAHKTSVVPKAGDIAFFYKNGKVYHVGLVVEVNSNGTFISIEGNKGNAVKRVTRAITECKCFGHPEYTESPTPTPKPGGKIKVEVRELYYKKGNVFKGEDVKSIQAIVGAEQDGSFGPATKRAVQKWQAAHGLNNDGIVGPKTYAAMFKAG